MTWWQTKGRLIYGSTFSERITVQKWNLVEYRRTKFDKFVEHRRILFDEFVECKRTI